jgi:RNA polymerase sigma-70 factor (ECF subfamily)
VCGRRRGRYACLAGRLERTFVHDPDPRILARARGGDLGAFEELVRTYQADVWRFSYSFTRDRALAEDVTQEAFIRAFRFIGTFRGDAKFSSWLFRIARNCAMDAIRARKGHDERAQRQPTPVGPSDPETRAELNAALAAVSEDHREPFLLVEVFGLSYQEAADVLNVRVGTIKSRMHRARQAMMIALATEEDAGGL